jgi:hypothetical protein
MHSVLQARLDELSDMVVRDGVVHLPPVAARRDEVAIAEQAELMTDGGDGHTGEFRQVADTRFAQVDDTAKNSQPTRISQGGEQPAEALDLPIGKGLEYLGGSFGSE